MTRHRDPNSPRAWLRLDDAQLLADCEVDTYRASGPGGQKRNKTSSAVRLRHKPSGLIVTAVESRSQHENRARALRRLRRAIALTQRQSTADEAHPAFYAEALARDATLRVSPKHSDYWLIVHYVLDVFAQEGARTAAAAERLHLTTAQLVRFLQQDPALWEQVNRLRQAAGLPLLR